MTDGYTKLFSSIVTSSIWGENPSTCKVWITLLALANQHGEVSASVPGLARAAVVSIEECEAALEVLTAPDRYSRTSEFDGRRIEPSGSGWLILNHAMYRRKASEEARREQAAERKRRQRSRESRTRHALSQQAEAEAEAEAEAAAARDTKCALSGSCSHSESSIAAAAAIGEGAE